MNSIDLVSKTIKGKNPGRTPVYGWVSANLKEVLDKAYGSVDAFEDHYEFDMAHIFGGPGPFGDAELEPIRHKDGEVTPEAFLEVPLRSADRLEDYADIVAALKHHRDDRQRFCYIQTPGIFECLNGAFGIEDHLCWLALYPDELKQVYRRQALWNRRFAENAMDLGVDMVHVSDDWGGQNSLLFSREMWREMISPNHKITCDAVKARGKFLSLHSDGHVMPLMDDIVELGYEVFHPWQETANMPYERYLGQYSDRLAILGGLCIQSTIGFGNFSRLESEIRRVFSLLKGKRWMFCTTHFVQEHCSLEELVFAFDLAVKLARD